MKKKTETHTTAPMNTRRTWQNRNIAEMRFYNNINDDYNNGNRIRSGCKTNEHENVRERKIIEKSSRENQRQ